MSVGTLLVRADATVRMGTGHVMRCLALAQAWQDAGGQALFAIGESSPAIDERLRAERIRVAPVQALTGSVQDGMRLGELAAHYRPEWVVVDGYQFSAEYHAFIRSRGCRVLVVDDCGSCGRNGADVVLNQNLHAQEDMYRDLRSDTELLLGPRFAMLRREFNRWRGWRREVAPVGRRILVTMGGSDPDNFSAKVCEGLQDLKGDGVEMRIAVGNSNPHMASLRSVAQKWGGDARVAENIGDMAELMAWADVAVSSAGSTCWEMCMLGLPSILLVLADNQRLVAGELNRMGIAIDASQNEQAAWDGIGETVRSLLLSGERRKEMSRRGSELVDGRGAERVVATMRDFGTRAEGGARGEHAAAPHEPVSASRGRGVGV